jgi:CheY-like chemotaxis protein
MTQSITPKHIVLYADDDPDDLELVQDAFGKYSVNVEVITARNGGEALSYLQNLGDFDPKPCLIILDINMPVLDGKEVLERIRQREAFESIPVVLFTTSSMPMDKSYAKHLNAGFITKPIGIKQMEMITDQFISHCTDEIQEKIRRSLQ